MTEALRPGLLVLHGNRLESLAGTVFQFLQRHPLAPLEEEVFLVQSNGMAEWLKMELAAAHGVSAATRVELPARFLWRAYRAVLGRAAVPAASALDKLPLTWRLMRLLPALAEQAAFAPVAGFLNVEAGNAARRLQLAQGLADLFDQYQVYRGDWLHDWAQGEDRLRIAPEAGAQPLPPDQAWQPALWRAVLAELAPEQRAASRAQLHERFVRALRGPGARLPFTGLPRRLVLFGTTHLPLQTLEALAALKDQVQVLMAVPNPCRFFWADTLSGHERLRAARRRHAPRTELEVAALPEEQLHAHGHPLLAAWGRQSRDFIRALDVFDDVQQARERFAVPRVDLFNHEEAATQPPTLLQQVQAHIRDLLPLAEHPRPELPATDRSIVFHIAHSAQREVEVLHDRLLHLLAQRPAEGQAALAPRDIVVMVPEIDRFAPAIRAVFGQHPRGHARHIPWGLADQRERGRLPLLVALEWLLRAPQQRFTFSELRSLLDVPAVARRLALNPEQVATLLAWASAANVRWGLHEAQRAGLGLGALGSAHSWRFGLRRLLLGYAAGELPEGFAGIEPLMEVGGLDAGLAGVLAEWLQALEGWWAQALQPRPPQAWGDALRALLQAHFTATDDADRALLAALNDALAAWLQACEAAEFTDAVPLDVVREAWLQALDDSSLPGGGRRFKAGGVTFCTLLPMRAIPFEVVCLLGMNEGDYPRAGRRSDFDLLGLPGLSRPGDRSRRDDDRQLLLDALLSARRVLYLSWAGRSVRDHTPQPPSVLVAQLRDYLTTGWGQEALAQRTLEHPLQPFSRRYFEADEESQLFTYAAEWRAAHLEPAASPPAPQATAEATPPCTLDELARFLVNPVKAYFRLRLQVVFDDGLAVEPDDEPFASDGLERWQQLQAVLQAARPEDVAAEVARLQRAGALPQGGPGEREADGLARTLAPMLEQAQQWQAEHPQRAEPLALRLPGLLDDWLDGLHEGPDPSAPPQWLELRASKLLAWKKGEPQLKQPRVEHLLPAWLRGLAAAAAGRPVQGVLIGADAVAQVPPIENTAEAADTLAALLQARAAALGAAEPPPTALRTGLAWLAQPGKPEKARTAYEGSGFSGPPGEGEEACLARLYPDFEALQADGRFAPATLQLYGAFQAWLEAGAFTLELLPHQAAGVDDGEDGEADDD